MLAHSLAHTSSARHLRIVMNEQDRREPTTDVAPPLTDRDTQPPPSSMAVAGTMLPARAPLSLEDSYLDRAIRVVADAGQYMRENREEARRQHNAVIEAIGRSDANQTRNYEMVRDELRRLKESEVTQDAKIASVSAELLALTGRISVIERSQVQSSVQEELREVKESLASLLEIIETMGHTDKTELAGRKVLIVDDVAILLRTLTRALASRGATVLTASTIDETRQQVAQYDPDCVIVDVRLGDESGIPIAEWLVRDAGLAPSRVILMTGAADESATKAAAELQLRLLEKPTPTADLVAAILVATPRPS